MRPQSPKFFQTQTIATTRVVNSPPRDKRHDSCGRLAKVTTYQSRPKTTVTTTTYRPVIETRTVKLCTEKKCQGHETLIDQLTQENNKLSQRVNELQNELDLQVEKFDSEQQVWVNTSMEIESMRKLLEETQKNHKQEVTYLNSELNTFKSQFQYQDDQIRFLSSQLKQQEVLENKIALLSSEIERLQFVIEDKNEGISQLKFRVSDYEKQLQVGQNVIEERNQQISELQQKSNNYEQELLFSNNIIHELKFEITQKDSQTQQMLAQKESLMQTFRENLELLEKKLAQSQQNEQLQDVQIDTIQKERENLNSKIQQLETELNEQKEQNLQLNQQVIINDQNNLNLQNQLIQQTQHHENLLSNKDNEHELTKQEREALVNQLEQVQQEIVDKTKEIDDLKNQNQSLISQLQEKTTNLDQVSEQLETTKSKLDNFDEMNKNLQLKLSQNEIENVELKDDLNLKSESIQQLENQLESQIEINKQSQNLISKLNQEKSDIESKNQILETEIKQQEGQIEEQNTQIRERIQETEVVQQQLNEQIDQLKKEQDNLLTQNKDLQSQITKLQQINDNHQLCEDSLKEEKLLLIQQILLQCFEIEKLKILESQQQEKLSQSEKKILLLEEQFEKFKENSILNSQKQETKITELQQQIDEDIKQIDSLKNDLKYQLSLEEELNKKNHFQQDQISHLQGVEQQLKYLNEQTNLQAKNLQKELENKIESESSLRFKLEKLLEELKIKQMQLGELDSQMRQIEQNNNIELSNLEERNSYLQNEVETWRQKFSILNKDYHRVQEDLMMLQAEFDAHKKRGQDLKNVKESTYFEVRKSSLYKENIDIKGSQTSIGRIFKENI
ncbi:unnamed protein product [Paramecium octaurelia]|uniref:Uncharacterized protein n=1 Tax=Paramecium octaurelia TaxID=43137 RepID=A0A8S1T9A7_PAROT|nr:unnamed protein product [Paramecium octaurelia]